MSVDEMYKVKRGNIFVTDIFLHKCVVEILRFYGTKMVHNDIHGHEQRLVRFTSIYTKKL